MNLGKSSNVERLKLCKQYFYIGFAFLPLVWLTNVVWFYKYAFVVEEFEERKKLRQYVVGSLAGVIFWLCVMAAWVITYQVVRAQGVEWADRITFIFPLGRV